MEVSRYVNLFYATCFIIAVVIYGKVVESVWGVSDALVDYAIVGNTITLTSVIAVVAAFLTVGWTFKKDEYRTYVAEVVVELYKVTWPNFIETRRSTFVVILFTVFVSLYLFFFDQVWKYVTDLILVQG